MTTSSSKLLFRKSFCFLLVLPSQLNFLFHPPQLWTKWPSCLDLKELKESPKSTKSLPDLYTKLFFFFSPANHYDRNCSPFQIPEHQNPPNQLIRVASSFRNAYPTLNWFLLSYFDGSTSLFSFFSKFIETRKETKREASLLFCFGTFKIT